MHVEAWIWPQPRLDLGMLVSGIVVADQMQFFFLGRFPINLTQEVQPLGVAMPLRTARGDGAAEPPEVRELLRA